MEEHRLLCLATFTSHKIFLAGTNLYTIGRMSTNDLVFNHPKISYLHCLLKITSGLGVVLTDLSSNGTWVNGNLVGKGNTCVVHSGDRLALPGESFGKFREFVYRKLQEPTPRNSIWSQYERGKQLGKGTFGSVYKCMERVTGAPYAIKMIDSHRFGVGSGMKNMIRREIQIMKELKSQNDHIVQFKESFEDGHIIYLVLEYIGGGDLGQRLHNFPAPSENEAKGLLRQICDGVSFIHDRGIAHRDLKPENILMTTDSPPKLKIADFGLGKLTDHETYLKTKCGTPDYVAPEVLQQDNAQYNNKVDSWSVGVIAFYMLTGEHPFKYTDSFESGQFDVWRSASAREVDWMPFLTRQQKYTSDCFDFLRCLIVEDPTQRWSIKQALTHHWLVTGDRGATTEQIASLAPKLLNNIQSTGKEKVDQSLLMPGAYPKSLFK